MHFNLQSKDGEKHHFPIATKTVARNVRKNVQKENDACCSLVCVQWKRQHFGLGNMTWSCDVKSTAQSHTSRPMACFSFFLFWFWFSFPWSLTAYVFIQFICSSVYFSALLPQHLLSLWWPVFLISKNTLTKWTLTRFDVIHFLWLSLVLLWKIISLHILGVQMYTNIFLFFLFNSFQ